MMNNSNSNFHNNNLNIENKPSNGENTNICIIQKSSTGHSSSNSIHKKQSNIKKISINKGPSVSSKGISIPKINLLKTTKSMSVINSLSHNKNSNNNNENNYYTNNNKNNNNYQTSNYKSSEKSKVISSNKLRSIIDLHPVSNIILDNRINANFNNSFILNESSCELISNREKDKKTANLESINHNNYPNNLELYKDNLSPNIEIRDNLILEKPQYQEEEDDEIYNNAFEHIENFKNVKENKETVNVSINNLNSILIKEKPENFINNNFYFNEKANEKIENNFTSLKDRKTSNSNKDMSSGVNSRKSRTRGFNNTLAKSLSPSKLTIQHGKLVSEFNPIKELEENKVNSPDSKAIAAVKNLVSFNNPTKMNLFCINKEKFFLVNYF